VVVRVPLYCAGGAGESGGGDDGEVAYNRFLSAGTGERPSSSLLRYSALRVRCIAARCLSHRARSGGHH